jgi:hypothetical protein
MLVQPIRSRLIIIKNVKKLLTLKKFIISLPELLGSVIYTLCSTKNSALLRSNEILAFIRHKSTMVFVSRLPFQIVTVCNSWPTLITRLL